MSIWLIILIIVVVVVVFGDGWDTDGGRYCRLPVTVGWAMPSREGIRPSGEI